MDVSRLITIVWTDVPRLNEIVLVDVPRLKVVILICGTGGMVAFSLGIKQVVVLEDVRAGQHLSRDRVRLR